MFVRSLSAEPGVAKHDEAEVSVSLVEVFNLSDAFLGDCGNAKQKKAISKRGS